MKLFPRFGRPSTLEASHRPAWHQRESDLLWGAPLTLFPALAVVPVTVSLFLDPFFPHARVAGLIAVLLMAISAVAGLSRLASCFRRDFDVITFFAAGTVIVLIVVCMSSGIVLASVLGT
jgi:hypothetical protein